MKKLVLILKSYFQSFFYTPCKGELDTRLYDIENIPNTIYIFLKIPVQEVCMAYRGKEMKRTGRVV